MDEKDRIIAELRALVAEQAAQLQQLEARIAELELEPAEAKKDSSTSSKPLSGDIVKPKRKTAKPSRKEPRQGAQPGHPRQWREPLPPERVDETIGHEIDEDQQQKPKLVPTGAFEVIRHIELPETPIRVTPSTGSPFTRTPTASSTFPTFPN